MIGDRGEGAAVPDGHVPGFRTDYWLLVTDYRLLITDYFALGRSEILPHLQMMNRANWR